MDIKKFGSTSNCDNKEFLCGIKFTPKKTLNKSTDGIFIFKERYLTGQDEFTLTFKRSYEGLLKCNNFVLNSEKLKELISLCEEFYYNYNNNFDCCEKEFIVQNEGEILINAINEEYIKICSIKLDNIDSDRVFFRLHKTELKAYIKTLTSIYLNNEFMDSLHYELENIINPLTRKEKNTLYLNALYVFADNALDKRDIQGFYKISEQIKQISCNLLPHA